MADKKQYLDAAGAELIAKKAKIAYEMAEEANKALENTYIPTYGAGVGLSESPYNNGDVMFNLKPASSGEIGGVKISGLPYTNPITPTSTEPTTNRNYPLCVDSEYKAFVTVPWEKFSPTQGTGIIVSGETISLKTASNTEIGGVKIGAIYDQNVRRFPITNVSPENDQRNYAINISSDGAAFVTVPWEGASLTNGTGINISDDTISLKNASPSEIGGIIIGKLYSGVTLTNKVPADDERNFVVNMLNDGTAFVTVPRDSRRWADDPEDYEQDPTGGSPRQHNDVHLSNKYRGFEVRTSDDVQIVVPASYDYFESGEEATVIIKNTGTSNISISFSLVDGNGGDKLNNFEDAIFDKELPYAIPAGKTAEYSVLRYDKYGYIIVGKIIN